MSHISDILTASYSTSREAFELGRELKSFIGAENNYEVIRLALGRSLGQESHPDSAPDQFAEYRDEILQPLDVRSGALRYDTAAHAPRKGRNFSPHHREDETLRLRLQRQTPV